MLGMVQEIALTILIPRIPFEDIKAVNRITLKCFGDTSHGSRVELLTTRVHGGSGSTRWVDRIPARLSALFQFLLAVSFSFLSGQDH